VRKHWSIITLDSETFFRWCAYRYKVRGWEIDDLIQEAKIAFLKCIKHYNPDKVKEQRRFVEKCIVNHYMKINRGLKRNIERNTGEITVSMMKSWGAISIGYQDIETNDFLSRNCKPINANIVKGYIMGYSNQDIRQIIDDEFGVKLSCGELQSRMAEQRRRLREILLCA
jgi:hypothetical protein